MKRRRLWLLSWLLLIFGAALASSVQNTPGSPSKAAISKTSASPAHVTPHLATDIRDFLAGIGRLPARYLDKVSAKADHLDKQLSRPPHGEGPPTPAKSRKKRSTAGY